MRMETAIPERRAGTTTAKRVEEKPKGQNINARAILGEARHELDMASQSYDTGDDRVRGALVHVMRLWEYAEKSAANAHEVDDLLEQHEIYRTKKWKTDPFTPLLKLVCEKDQRHKANITRWADALKDATRHDVKSEALLDHFAKAGGPTNCSKRERTKRQQETNPARAAEAAAALERAIEVRKEKTKPIEPLAGIEIADEARFASILFVKTEKGLWPVGQATETEETARRFLPELRKRGRQPAQPSA
jgi:hypothetical protein